MFTYSWTVRLEGVWRFVSNNNLIIIIVSCAVNIRLATDWLGFRILDKQYLSGRFHASLVKVFQLASKVKVVVEFFSDFSESRHRAAKVLSFFTSSQTN